MTAGGSGRGKYNIEFFGCRSAQASVNGLRIGNCRPMGAPHQGREASHRGNDVDSRQPQNRNSPSRGARKFIGLKPRATSKWCDLSHAGSQSVSPQVQYCRSSPCFSLTGRHRVCIAGGLVCPKALECPKRLIMSLQLVAAVPIRIFKSNKIYVGAKRTWLVKRFPRRKLHAWGYPCSAISSVESGALRGRAPLVSVAFGNQCCMAGCRTVRRVITSNATGERIAEFEGPGRACFVPLSNCDDGRDDAALPQITWLPAESHLALLYREQVFARLLHTARQYGSI